MKLKTYKYTATTGLRKIKTKTALVLSTAVLAVGGTTGMAIATFGSAHALGLTNENGCSIDETATTWTLHADCTATNEINVPAGVAFDGAGHTISASFMKTDNDHNAVLGIVSANNVTVSNVVIDGAGGTNLHGINVFNSTGVALNDVTVENNDHNGLVVNASSVTVSNITTANNGWGGVDVDKGTSITPAVLTINGTSTQTEPVFLGVAIDVYVDEATSTFNSVVDTNSQYLVSHNIKKTGDAVYSLKATPRVKDDCKNGGWQNLKATNGNSFKNQGACVSYVASNGKSQH